MKTPTLLKINNPATVEFLEAFLVAHPVHPRELTQAEGAALRADFTAKVKAMRPEPKFWEQIVMADYLHARWHGVAK